MAYLALYRKYRPTTFDKLIGQDSVVKTLTNQIESGRLGHAYLFTGSRGTGKTSAAKIFARAVNCLHPINGSPCGKCEACKALSDASNIDVIELDAASNNGVNEIRDLREKVQYPPVSCKHKVYIIDEVHMLTGAAFNALLKTLEEPPKHVIFILATTEVHKIPATILSRCMRFDFKLVSTEEIANLIFKIYDEQGKAYEKEAVYAIAKAGEGSIRDALSIADTALSYGNGKLSYADVNEIIGSTGEDVLLSFLGGILGGNAGSALDLTDKLVSSGKSMGVLTKDLCLLLRNLIVAKICKNPNKILLLPEDNFNALSALANSTNTERLLRVLEVFSDSENMLKYSNHPRVLFETAAVKAARPDSDYSIDALLARIKSLEDKLDEICKGNILPAYSIKDNASAKNNSVKTETVKITETNKEFKQDDEKSDVSPKITTEKPSISTAGDKLLGELLSNLRKNGSEMLWTVLQSVEISVGGNVLTIKVSNEGDDSLLSRKENLAAIADALNDYAPFTCQVMLSDKEKAENKMEEDSEKIKKLFGDDIVIIKED